MTPKWLDIGILFGIGLTTRPILDTQHGDGQSSPASVASSKKAYQSHVEVALPCGPSAGPTLYKFKRHHCSWPSAKRVWDRDTEGEGCHDRPLLPQKNHLDQETPRNWVCLTPHSMEKWMKGKIGKMMAHHRMLGGHFLWTNRRHGKCIDALALWVGMVQIIRSTVGPHNQGREL